MVTGPTKRVPGRSAIALGLFGSVLLLALFSGLSDAPGLWGYLPIVLLLACPLMHLLLHRHPGGHAPSDQQATSSRSSPAHDAHPASES